MNDSILGLVNKTTNLRTDLTTLDNTVNAPVGGLYAKFNIVNVSYTDFITEFWRSPGGYNYLINRS